MDAARRPGLSYPAAASAMALLVEVGVAGEITGNRRNRIFAYERAAAPIHAPWLGSRRALRP